MRAHLAFDVTVMKSNPVILTSHSVLFNTDVSCTVGAKEMAQRFRAFPCRGTGSVLNTYLMANNTCNSILGELTPSAGTKHTHDAQASVYTKH